MFRRVGDAIWDLVVARLNRERATPEELPPCDFERLSYEIRPCDVLLVEGRSRVGEVIKYITLSPWTHAALYIGRLHDIDDPRIRERICEHYDADPDEQLIVEALLGQGTIVAPLARYRDEHVRVCRPRELARRDAQAVIGYCAHYLGQAYDVRQLLDLARFMFPYGLLPRRWRSSLFTHNAGAPTRIVCSSLIARAFASVRFPVLPLRHDADDGRIQLHRRNFKLFVPADFDFSPYFEIIKYPLLEFDELAVYRRMPWTPDGDPDALEQPPAVGDDDPSATTDEAAVEAGDESLVSSAEPESDRQREARLDPEAEQAAATGGDARPARQSGNGG